MARSVVVSLLLLHAAILSAQSVPAASPVVVVALENQSYSDVVGSPAMPYFNSLISQGALTTNFYANTHPSISNYFALTTGELVTLESGFNARVSIDNIARRLKAAGKTWKAYAQSIPSAGYLGDSYPYVKRHNPFAYFTDIIDNAEQRGRMVPLEQFSSDLSAGSLPDFSFIIPDQYHNAHDCPGGGTTCSNNDKLAAADQFLAEQLAPLLTSAAFQADGLLVVWWDEGKLSDYTNGGGRIAVVLVGPRVKRGYQSGAFYRQEHLGRTLFEALSLPTALGTILYATPIADVFGPAGSTPGNIVGRVTSVHDGWALSGATVSYSGGSTLADSNGNYALSNLTPGTYTVTAQRSGWLPRSQSVTVTSGGTATANFQLSTAGKIMGTVQASGGIAISGATVQCSGGVIPTTVTRTTASNGFYDCGWLPTGSYTVSASAAGYVPQTKNATVTTGATSAVNFTLLK